MGVSGVGPGGDQSQGPSIEPGGPSGNAPVPPPPDASKKPSPMDLAGKHHHKKDTDTPDGKKTPKDLYMEMEISIAMHIMQQMQQSAAQMKRIWLKHDDE